MWKHCYPVVISMGLSLERDRSVSGWHSGWGRSPIWEFCCVLEALARWCVPPTCPLGSLLLGLPHDHGWDFEYVLFRRRHTPSPAGTSSAGIRWAMALRRENEKILVCIQLVSACATGPRSSSAPRPLGMSQGCFKVPGRWLWFCLLCTWAEHHRQQSLQSLIFSRDLFRCCCFVF